MAREQLGTPPSDNQDAVTKAYVVGLSTATGKSLMTAADAAAARAAIGLVFIDNEDSTWTIEIT